MADGDDLPDHDYASIYGHEALQARSDAWMKAALRSQRDSLARIDAILAKMDARDAQWQQRHDKQ